LKHQPNSPPIQPEMLMLAYRSGIFPMADARDDPDVFWVEPRQRAILPLDGFHCSKSLARTLRRGTFSVTCNTAFNEVIAACAAPRKEEGETWISHRIALTYALLHARGLAHSVECWHQGQLVGGLYGVGFDRVFCGESMFSRMTDASKVALAWLVAALREGGAELLDCQFITGHLSSLGAVEIPQAEYLRRLSRAQRESNAGTAQRSPVTAGAALAEGEAAGAATVLEASPPALPEAFATLLARAKSAGLSSSPGKLIAQSLTQTS
jgi:leucyl/phenylalanyl-tRNA--protein transferase